MDYLQYYTPPVTEAKTEVEVLNLVINGLPSILKDSTVICSFQYVKVLNLVINGLPSIQCAQDTFGHLLRKSFKPCYKWITFNTVKYAATTMGDDIIVLNLVINGLPSIPLRKIKGQNLKNFVLNLVINGLPSIPLSSEIVATDVMYRFKPCYKWITFNTFYK